MKFTVWNRNSQYRKLEPTRLLWQTSPMIKITPKITIAESELVFSFVRSPGPGGQNVNKVATAAELRFDLKNSSALPEEVRTRLYKMAANKINQQGELIIKAVLYRSQERNKQDALKRLAALIKLASISPKKRKKTKPTKSSVEERLAQKKQRSRIKSLRKMGRDLT
ncbi:MAG TPA: alternative ribosome rescue aminoacyl-tRNA hydrolase ArfB [Coxiellaceae bacterium]|nr:alternative ribosome rescue aminoacyl-tRNA hydrolase ArfB [Coxiellaceae bacterium]